MARWSIRIAALSGLVALAAAAIFAGLNWAPDRSVAELAARWAGPPSTFIRADGMDVHLWDEGPRDGRPVVLLHGTGSSLHTWDGWTEALAADHRVIRFDLPGFGLTGPDPQGDYTIEAYVEFVIAVLDALGLERVALAGNSLGGHIAWATAALHPDRIERLILVDSSGIPVQSTSVPIGFRIARLPVISRLSENVLTRGFVESSVRNVFGDPSLVTDELVDRYYELSLREGNREALVQRMQQISRGALSERIGDIEQPTLILWGERDGLIPISAGRRFDDTIADSRFVSFEALGHVPHEEAPGDTVRPVLEFLAGD